MGDGSIQRYLVIPLVGAKSVMGDTDDLGFGKIRRRLLFIRAQLSDLR